MPDFFLRMIPPDTPPGWALAAMATAVVVIGIAKSGFGGGIGILAVPLMALALNPANAIGVMLPVLLAADILAVLQHRRHRSPHHLRLGLIGAVGGVFAGTAALWSFGELGLLTPLLNLTVGLMCIGLVAVQCFRLLGGAVPRVPDTTASGVTAGGLAGFVSTLAHSAGPIMSIYLLEHRVDKARLVGTLVLFFFLLNLMKLPTFLGLGLIDRHTLAASAVCLVLVPVGSLVGFWMHGRIRERPFVLVMYLGAAAAGGRMIYKAFL